MRVRQALRADLDDVTDIWVDAFSTDPFLRWMGAADDTSWPGFGRAWLGMIARLCFERGHLHVTDSADAAVAWIPPDLSMMGPDDFARATVILLEHGGPERQQAALTTIRGAHEHTPVVPHWTLQYIGVRASVRATGVGATLVAPYLARCDDEALPCGLVSSNPRNVSFYERCGFTVTTEVTTPDGAATLRPMLRPPA